MYKLFATRHHRNFNFNIVLYRDLSLVEGRRRCSILRMQDSSALSDYMRNDLINCLCLKLVLLIYYERYPN